MMPAGLLAPRILPAFPSDYSASGFGAKSISGHSCGSASDSSIQPTAGQGSRNSLFIPSRVQRDGTPAYIKKRTKTLHLLSDNGTFSLFLL